MPPANDTPTPVTVAAPQSLGDVNELLLRLGSVQREIGKHDKRKSDRIAKANAEADQAKKPLDAEEDALIDAILNFAIANKDDLTNNQTIKLTNGEITWRTDGVGTLTFLVDEALVIAKLERIKDGKKFVVVKKSVDKVPLKGDKKVLDKLKGMATVTLKDTVAITTTPTTAQKKRGAKTITRVRDQ